MKYTFSLFLISLSLLSAPAFAQLQIINTIAGTGVTGYSGDGYAATAADLNGPLGVAVDSAGNVYVEDYYNHRVRKINASGKISTYAGNGGIGSTGDGTIATSAQLNPSGIAVDRHGNLYISDAAHGVVRKVNTLGIISTIAGTGSYGYTGDNAAATLATLNTPCGLATDTLGNIYIADAGNNVVRKVNAAGIITTLAGTGVAGSTGDGNTAISAELDSPYAVAADNYGNVYISDYKNNYIRKVDTSGYISAYAGLANTVGYGGDSSTALLSTLNGPRGLAVDGNRNLYIADANNNVIRRVDTFGIITTAVGNGFGGYGGDLGTVNGANLYSPYGVAVDQYGSIYIADANNQRVRKTYNATLGVKTLAAANGITVYPNPFSGSISIAGLSASDKVCVYDINGRAVTETTTVNNAGTTSFEMPNISEGIYLLQVWDNAGNKKAVVRLVKD